MILGFDFTGGLVWRGITYCSILGTGDHGYAPFPHICNLHLHRYIILHTNLYSFIANTCSNDSPLTTSAPSNPLLCIPFVAVVLAPPYLTHCGGIGRTPPTRYHRVKSHMKGTLNLEPLTPNQQHSQLLLRGFLHSIYPTLRPLLYIETSAKLCVLSG
ncbi:hypothetical protein BDQ17DRAFT_393482 [Cyathus striatus]|nr:hypothetical protein BDQ17DRAFT_393482 [Cyathus striatus]